MRTYLIIFFLLSSIHFFGQNKNEDLSEALRMVNAWMEAQRDFDKLQGVSIAVVKDQDIIYKKALGYSNVEMNTPAKSSTIYSICSISKLFTSIAIMQLWEQGKLRLDDSVSGLLPIYAVKQAFPESGPITIRSLLTHSAGLPRESDYPYWTDFKFPSKQEVNDKFKNQETLYPASTYFQYSNLGMTILGEIVSKVSGVPFEDYVEKNILMPLRLRNTHSYMPERLWGKELAVGYSALSRNGERKKLPYFNANGITPAAGFSSTAEDLALFAAWQFRLLKNGGYEILKASTLREMQRVQWLDPDWKNSWGLGFIIFQADGNTYVGHDGSCPGYKTSLQMDINERMAVVVMTNTQGVSLDKYTNGIFSILRLGKSKPEKDSLNLDQYAGYYDNYAWRGEVAVLPWQGKLAVFDLPNNDPGKAMALFKPISKDIFRRIRNDGSLGEELRFERGANNSIIIFWRHNNPYDKLKRSISF